MAQAIPILAAEQWQAMWHSGAPLLLFKHSTTCGISAAVNAEFERWLPRVPADKLRVARVRVIEERPISQQIAADTGVLHQSPQALLIQGKKVLWSASHYAITEQSLQAAVAKAGL